MNLSQNPESGPNRRMLILIAVGVIAVVIVCLLAVLLAQILPAQKLFQLVSSSPTRVALSTVTPGVIQPPPSPSDTSTAVVLLPTITPKPSLTSTPTITPTRTRTPTLSPTADLWVSVGQWKVGASTEITFTQVSASRLKFQVVGGGGDDKLISFICCGSSGAAWFVNNAWLPVANQSLTLRVGETRETVDFGGALVSRMRFNVGVNDNEQIDVRVSYLPGLVATPTLTTTVTLTATVVPTATASITPTIAITATATPTSTVVPTATLTVSPTATLTTTTGVITPTVPVTATRPAEPKGSVAFHKNDNGIDRVFVANLENNSITPLLDIGPVMDIAMSTNAAFGAWAPDNSKFAYISTVSPGASNILRVIDFSANTTKALFSSDTGGGLSSPTWSPDGTRIAFIRVAGNQRVWAIDVVKLDGTKCSDHYECEITTNTQAEQFRGGLEWSKQGLFALAFNTTGANNVHTMFMDGVGRVNITNSTADNSTPAWSPDGKQIAFTSTRDGRPQIYVMNLDGSGLRRVSQSDAADFAPTWSPDGNWIAFASFRNGSTDIYRMDLYGGNVTRLTKTGGDRPIWSR